MTFANRGSMLFRSAALVGLVLVALVAGACGDDDSSGEAAADKGTTTGSELPKEALVPRNAEEEKIVAMYTEYADAMANADAKGACSALTSSARQGISGGLGCEGRMKAIYASGKESDKKPYIVRLKLRGGHANAGVKTVTSKVYGVSFAKQPNGDWKISGDTDG
jgi:hypothetical protein